MGIRKGLLIILFLILGFTTFLYIHVQNVDNTVIPEVVVSDQTVSAVGDGMDAGSVDTAVSPADAPVAPPAGPVDSMQVTVTVVPKKVPTPPAPAVKEVVGEKILGKASFYDYQLKNGWSSKGHYVCAMRDYPRGTYVRVTNLANGKVTECKVTDYGPDASVHPDRIIDLSSTAFAAIGSTRSGILSVEVVKIK